MIRMFEVSIVFSMQEKAGILQATGTGCLPLTNICCPSVFRMFYFLGPPGSESTLIRTDPDPCDSLLSRLKM
jgi:hypothetical protein